MSFLFSLLIALLLETGPLFVLGCPTATGRSCEAAMLLPLVTITAAAMLEASKLSQRAIAKKLRISRGVVRDIASGKRPVVLRPKYPASKAKAPEPPPMEKCVGCGAMVQLPCRACLVRNLLKAGRLTPGLRLSEIEGMIRVELRGEELTRYNELHAVKVARSEERGASSEQRPDEANQDVWSEPTFEQLEEIEGVRG